ncbi:MAG: hypothetical protein Q8O86_11550 [Dehalococcoidia bacterium]|nr:hypothetical protein [Dehalococcoidia bacterium]
MDTDRILERLLRIEEDIRAIEDSTPVPALAMALKHMEAYCHLALDHLSYVQDVCPEAE